MEKFTIPPFITITLYFVLTLPFISFILFGFGFNYPLWLLLVCSFISIISSPIIYNKFFKK
jgi:hypothetical protein